MASQMRTHIGAFNLILIAALFGDDSPPRHVPPVAEAA
jgi:hypothetical protein